MNGKFILDTNILIGLFAHVPAVVAAINVAHELLIPSIVIGELYYGAFNSGKARQNVQKIDIFRNSVPVLSCDDETSKYYGDIKYQLKQAGTPIPENDIWIATLSLQHQIPLVSRDKHFEKVKGLKLVKW